MQSSRLWRSALLLTLCLPAATFAHAHLEQADPADGAVISSPPAQFMLYFSEAAQLTALSLKQSGRTRAQKLSPLPAVAAAQLTVPAPPLDFGSYELRYRVISADGHVMAGSVHFTIAAR